jgi:hypothetical protein
LFMLDVVSVFGVIVLGVPAALLEPPVDVSPAPVAANATAIGVATSVVTSTKARALSNIVLNPSTRVSAKLPYDNAVIEHEFVRTRGFNWLQIE